MSNDSDNPENSRLPSLFGKAGSQWTAADRAYVISWLHEPSQMTRMRDWTKTVTSQRKVSLQTREDENLVSEFLRARLDHVIDRYKVGSVPRTRTFWTGWIYLCLERYVLAILRNEVRHQRQTDKTANPAQTLDDRVLRAHNPSSVIAPVLLTGLLDTLYAENPIHYWTYILVDGYDLDGWEAQLALGLIVPCLMKPSLLKLSPQDAQQIIAAAAASNRCNLEELVVILECELRRVCASGTATKVIASVTHDVLEMASNKIEERLYAILRHELEIAPANAKAIALSAAGTLATVSMSECTSIAKLAITGTSRLSGRREEIGKRLWAEIRHLPQAEFAKPLKQALLPTLPENDVENLIIAVHQQAFLLRKRQFVTDLWPRIDTWWRNSDAVTMGPPYPKTIPMGSIKGWTSRARLFLSDRV